jgi:glycosyltransferase involved in cell wall biosynthesis
MNRSFHVKNPEVSVLMSCYNGRNWLHEAIDSVLVQSFEAFELILVDDGSTDETWNIIQSYRDRDERIVAISKKNTGLADSLNVGIALARGAWIARLDQDDLCEPTRLMEQVNFVHNYPEVVLLGTGFFEIDKHGRVIKKNLYPTVHRKLVRNLERSQRFFPHSSAFYRTDVVKQVGGYNVRIRRADDWRLWLELTLRGRIACLPKPLVRIRKHSDQMSLERNGRSQLYDAIAATVCHLLRKAGYDDPSTDANADEWIAFLNWIENRIEESGAFEKHNAWREARTAFLAPENKLSGAFRFTSYLIQSGYASTLVWEKFFGSSLPQRLALAWMSSRK